MVKPLYERVIVSFSDGSHTQDFYVEADIVKAPHLSDNPSKHIVMSNRFKSYRDNGLLVVRTGNGSIAELPLANITQIIWTGEFKERNNIRHDDYRKIAELKEDGTWQVD